MRVALERWVGRILYNPSYTPWCTALSGKSSAPSGQRYPFFLKQARGNSRYRGQRRPLREQPRTSEEVQWRR
jgi:hypothetical protein